MSSSQPLLQQPKFRQILQRIIPLIFYALLLIFLFFYIKSVDFGALRTLHVNWWYLVLASVIGLVARYWGVFIWLTLLKSLGAQELQEKTELAYVYAKSWLGRYIPGTAPWILGKIYFAAKHGISKNKLAVSSLLEGALQIVVTLTLASLLLVFDPRLDVIDSSMKVVMGVILSIGIITMIPPVFNKIIAFVYKTIKKKVFPSEHMAKRRTILQGVSLYVIGVILNGLAIFFVTKAIYPLLPFDNLLFIIGAVSLAAALSMLAIFAPSGLGVREGILLILLSLIMPKEFALMITVVTRLWAVAMDFVFFGIAKFLASQRKT